MNRLIFSTAITLLIIVPVASSMAATCSKQSAPHTVALLELYTSEGCSSCPPADRFVSNLLSSGLSLDQVIPLSLHVDYWDYIGWKDLYASPVFTERQRWLSALARSRTIYTPEVFVAGREFRTWQARGSVPDAVRRINAQPARAELVVATGSRTADKVPVNVMIQARQTGKLFVALYQNDIMTNVGAGENQGASLRHDHVVRQWLGPYQLTAGATQFSLAWSGQLTLPVGAPVSKLGIAAFVQNDDGEVLQALALPLCAG